MAWTKEQKQVIDERDNTILVSAAAGSGKTSVLVERIYQRLLDEKNPLDVSSFLVVTFTKLAASQMKEKLMKKLEKALQETPENEHLAKQNLLIQNADISTIDSFCLNLVKENFHMLGIDPSVNIGDSGMTEMLKNEVLNQFFEEKYGDADFERLVDMFCDGKSDDELKNLVNKIYIQVSSYPSPDQWIENARKALTIDTVEELDKIIWVRRLGRIAKHKAHASLEMAKQCLAICDGADGPIFYRPQIESDIEKFYAIEAAKGYEELKDALGLGWKALSRKSDNGTEETKKACKDIRDAYKKEFEVLKYLKADSKEVLQEMESLRAYLLPLLDFVSEFMQRFLDEKKARKMLEFSDISHMAYSLVCQGYDENGVALPTELGKKIAEQYEEIYIDEYQDSNYLQEDILTAISRKYRGVENMFMVGDVKQSIYRFRMARPELFVEKYNRFTKEGDEIKIELNHNFRSRDVVLKSINYFFYQLMGADLGGITYDENQALKTGKDYELLAKADGPVAEDVEFMIADVEDKGTLIEEDLENYKNLDTDKLEGHMIAQRIKELLDEDNGLFVFDEELEAYRKATYKDIVILARSLKGYGEVIYNTLAEYGIPVYLEKNKGYFNAVEIQVIMSLLAVVDNSRQDIPMAAVLLSPIGELDEDEMTVLSSYRDNQSKVANKERLCLYDRIEYFLADADESTELYQKVRKVWDVIEILKQDKEKLSISELVWKALNITNYYAYAYAMPDGEIRKANLDILMEKAIQFENGYYKGLFHFLQYVDKLKLQEKDDGEATVLSDDANVVRIMSMHKSKGLEFPIVFASGLGKQFNLKDAQGDVLLHPDFYLASMEMHEKGRYKKSTTLRDTYGILTREELMAEYIRLLYVAMTRAKEKLILTAGSSKFSKQLEKYANILAWDDTLLPYGMRLQAATYLDQLLPCMLRYEKLAKKYYVEDKIHLHVKSFADIVRGLQNNAGTTSLELAQIKQQAMTRDTGSYYDMVKDLFDYKYQYPLAVELPGKLATSDIKKMKAYDGEGYDINQEFAKNQQLDEPVEVDEQDFSDSANQDKKSESKTLSGSERGTLVHKYMELLPFEELAGISEVDALTKFAKDFKNQLLADGIFDELEATAINVRKIATMLASKLGQRMIQAAVRGDLFKEQQFSAGILAGAVYEKEQDKLTEEDVLIVQGIIDGFFYEDGQIVVMDYKTDACDEDTLVGRYKAQIKNYADVIEQLTGDEVKEQVFYSFYLGKEVAINP